jgi:hypothetical protein
MMITGVTGYINIPRSIRGDISNPILVFSLGLEGAKPLLRKLLSGKGSG